MKARCLTDYIFCIHDEIKNGNLFEGIWPLPHGVTLNSYIVKGEKTALIDPFKGWETQLDDSGLVGKIDYFILNHLEPDHSAWLKNIKVINPEAEILATAKGIELVKSFYHIESGLRAVADGETLDLGNGKTLQFFETPNVHWPETMVIWEAASGVLFSCDAFGSFGAFGSNENKDSRIFDDEYDAKEHFLFEEETLRYYSNIVSSFSGFVEKAVSKTAGLSIRIAAPGHGLIWRKDPQKIIDRYSKLASYAKTPEKEIAIVWGSMYGNTKAGLDAVIRGIEAEGVPYSLHRVPDEDISFILSAVYKAGGIVIAMPSYEYAMFPPMAYALDVFRRKHIFEKKVLRIGSYGWVGGAKKEYEAAAEKLRWTNLQPHEWAGYPTEADLMILEERGRELAKSLEAAN